MPRSGFAAIMKIRLALLATLIFSIASPTLSIAAGDRFESFVPGYQVVKDQSKMKRAALAVLSAGVAADLHSVVLGSVSKS
jgi:hypothetical protein